MINYKEWKLLNESLGSYTLGLKTPQNMGIVSKYHTASEIDGDASLEEMGMLPKLKMPMQPKYMDDAIPMKGKKPFPRPDMGDEEDELGDEEGMGHDELGDEEDMDHDELGDEEDDEIDPDAEFDDEEGEHNDMGDEDMDDTGDMGGHPMMPPKKKKFPMGQPHPGGPFMRFSKRMKSEECGDEGDEDMDDEKGDKLIVKKGKGKDDVEKGDELSFLQKKSMKKKMASGDTTAKDTKLGKAGLGGGKAAPKENSGAKKGKQPDQNISIGKTSASHSAKLGKTDASFKKGCSTGDDAEGKMCKKCSKSKKMKESSNDYARPQNVDTSDSTFIDSLKRMYGNPTERFSDGLRDVSEDLLLHPDLMPGQPGYPQPLHNHDDQLGVNESIDELQKRLANLERRLKK